MGSAVPLRPSKGSHPAKVVLLEMRAMAESSSAGIRGEPDVPALCRRLREAIEDPRNGRLVLLGLADYLAAAVTGTFLDLDSWDPPSR